MLTGETTVVRTTTWTGVFGVLLRAEVLFALIAGVFIAFFVFSVPAGWGLDEQSHDARAYQVSQGVLEPQLRADGETYGGPVPKALEDYLLLGHTWSNGVNRGLPYWERADFRDRAVYDRVGDAHVDPSRTTSVDFSNAGASSFVAYTPGAVGMAVARSFGADVDWMIVGGRIANGIVFVAFGVIALWLLRRSRTRWLVFGIALLPETVFQASYITADTYSNAISLLFVAGLLAMIGSRAAPAPSASVEAAVADEPVVRSGRRRFASPPVRASLAMQIGVGAAGLGVLAAKPTYVILLLLVLVVPSAALGGRRIAVWTKTAYLVVVAVITAVLLHLTSGISDAIRFQVPNAAQIDSGQQIEYVLHHPLSLVAVFVRTLVTYGGEYTQSLFGWFGYNQVALVEPFLLLAFLGIVIAALAAAPLPRWTGTVFLVVGLVSVAAVIGTLYLTFSSVGSAVSFGVQGRYFLPLVLPVAIGLASLLPLRLRASERAIAILIPSISGVCLLASAGLWLATLY